MEDKQSKVLDHSETSEPPVPVEPNSEASVKPSPANINPSKQKSDQVSFADIDPDPEILSDDDDATAQWTTVPDAQNGGASGPPDPAAVTSDHVKKSESESAMDAEPAAGAQADGPSAPTGTDSTGSANGQPPAGGEECYRYEGETCIYTDPSSGVEYVYKAESEGWVPRDGSGDGTAQYSPTLENCYYIGENYCFKDVHGQVYRLVSTSNSWEKWTPPPDAAAATSADQADTRFQDASGAWCCKDASGATLRWCGQTSQWIKPAGLRKRRLDRGSSDDSEHDSDEEVAPGGRTGPQVEPEAPSDGTGYEWDAEKGAWFPKIDEEFLALHRLNYGFDSEGRPVDAPPILSSAPPPPSLEEAADSAEPNKAGEANKQKKRPNKKKPEWFQLEDSKNTKVYVSDLPDSTTEEEFVELMSKCGLVAKDPQRKMAWKVKIYRDDYGVPKGDAVCTYIKIESVDLALSILDGCHFKGKTIKVERAQFNLKGSFDPTKKPKKKNLKKKDREKMQKKQEKLFAWQPDKIRGERERHERVVVIKRLFSPDEFQSRPQLILEYKEDIREECAKFGAVRKVVLHDRHKDGVVEVVFEEATGADACVLKMNGRFFAGRKLEAATWDGKTKYRVEETEAERAERLAKWDQFMADGGEEKPPEDGPAAPAPPAAGSVEAAGATASPGKASVPEESSEPQADGDSTPLSVSPEGGGTPEDSENGDDG